MTATATPFLQRLDEMKRRYDEISAELSKPEVASDPESLQKYGREQSEMAETVGVYERYLGVQSELDEAASMLDDGLDDEMKAFVEARVAEEGYASASEYLRALSKRPSIPVSSASSRPATAAGH